MVGVVQPKAAHDLDLLIRERREKLGHGQHLLGDLCRGVQGRAHDLVGFDRFPLVGC
jgi:hypothetical protein